MHCPTRKRHIDVRKRLRPARLKAYLTVALETRQPIPAQISDELAIRQSASPTVESHDGWRKATRLRCPDYCLDMVGFTQSIRCLVVQPKITRQTAIVVRPDPADQIDAVHDLMMFARPVTTDQRHLAGIRLVQRRVIHNQQAHRHLDAPPHFLSQRRPVRRQCLPPARVGIMRGPRRPVRMCSRCCRRAKHLLSRYRKVDIVVCVAFGRVHAPILSPFQLRNAYIHKVYAKSSFDLHNQMLKP